MPSRYGSRLPSASVPQKSGLRSRTRRVCGTYSTNLKGPVPTTTCCRSPCSRTTSSETITLRLCASFDSSGLNGSESVITTVSSSGAWMSATTAKSSARGEATAGSLILLIENTTSDACSVSPSWNLTRSEEHTSELQSRENLVCRLLLE